MKVEILYFKRGSSWLGKVRIVGERSGNFLKFLNSQGIGYINLNLKSVKTKTFKVREFLFFLENVRGLFYFNLSENPVKALDHRGKL